MAWITAGADGTVHHDELEKVPGPIGTNDEVAHWVLGDLLDNDRVADGMVDVSFFDAVPASGGQDIHTSESYYETARGSAVDNVPAASRSLTRMSARCIGLGDVLPEVRRPMKEFNGELCCSSAGMALSESVRAQLEWIVTSAPVERAHRVGAAHRVPSAVT